MCAIAGIIEKKGKDAPRKKLQKMIDIQAHRGPDDEGIYLKDNAGLGHRRLSILDTSSAGHQPMCSPGRKKWITYNGEIYNYLEIKKELGKQNYQSSSDTEVLLRAYETWGKDCVKKLNGIFAFAIWDERTKTLFAARDHLGVKPFYYAHQNGVFYFASEIKALLAAGVKTKPNDKIIYEYLVYGIYQHSDETFFENIYQLPAGHTLTYKDGTIYSERYWNPADNVVGMESWSDEHVAGEFFELFKDAIKIQLRSDVPVSIQLSGGFDSSAVTAMVNHVVKEQKNFRLFSFIYKNHRDKEVPYMKALAKGLGWTIDFLPIEPHDMPRTIEKVVRHQDEPFPGLPTFGHHALAKKCRDEGIPVVLGGQGGDEIGAGYEYYIGAFLLDMIQGNGATAAREELYAYGKAHGFNSDALHLTFFMDTLAAYLRPGTSADASAFAGSEALHKAFVKRAHVPRPLFQAPFDSHLANMQYRDLLHTKLPRVLHSADRSAMAYGVEQRVPLVDYRLVEFGLSATSSQKIASGTQRYFMRKAVGKIMPKKVAYAPKRAVPSPQRDWFKKELRPWVGSVISSKSFRDRPYFDQNKVLEIYRKYTNTQGIPENSFHLWQWIHLEYWMRAYFD